MSSGRLPAPVEHGTHAVFRREHVVFFTRATIKRLDVPHTGGNDGQPMIDVVGTDGKSTLHRIGGTELERADKMKTISGLFIDVCTVTGFIVLVLSTITLISMVVGDTEPLARRLTRIEVAVQRVETALQRLEVVGSAGAKHTYLASEPENKNTDNPDKQRRSAEGVE